MAQLQKGPLVRGYHKSIHGNCDIPKRCPRKVEFTRNVLDSRLRIHKKVLWHALMGVLPKIQVGGGVERLEHVVNN